MAVKSHARTTPEPTQLTSSDTTPARPLCPGLTPAASTPASTSSRSTSASRWGCMKSNGAGASASTSTAGPPARHPTPSKTIRRCDPQTEPKNHSTSTKPSPTSPPAAGPSTAGNPASRRRTRLAGDTAACSQSSTDQPDALRPHPPPDRHAGSHRPSRPKWISLSTIDTGGPPCTSKPSRRRAPGNGTPDAPTRSASAPAHSPASAPNRTPTKTRPASPATSAL